MASQIHEADASTNRPSAQDRSGSQCEHAVRHKKGIKESQWTTNDVFNDDHSGGSGRAVCTDARTNAEKRLRAASVNPPLASSQKLPNSGTHSSQMCPEGPNDDR
eukprot:gene22852-27886_t